MRTRTLLGLSLAGLAVAALAHAGLLSAHGPDPGATGAPEIADLPAEFTCALCHEGNPPGAPGGAVEILGIPAVYAPGQLYPLTVRLHSSATVAFPGRRWGFEFQAVRWSDGAAAGSFELPGDGTLQAVNGGVPFRTRTYVEHTLGGTRDGVAGPVEWTFGWRAPAAPEGTIHFFCAGVAANGTSGADGDWVYTTRDSSIAPGTTDVPPAQGVRLVLLPARPNPAPGAVTLAFALPDAGRAELTIHDARGRLVRRLLAGWTDAGAGTAHWDGRNEDGRAAPAGVYLARLTLATGDVAAVRKFSLAR